MSDLETRLFREAYKFLAAHASPPPESDEKASIAWWQTLTNDIIEVSARWKSHPLLVRLLTVVYEYLEEKAKEGST